MILAGIRESQDKVEEIGVEYSKQSLNEADVVLFVYDASLGIQSEDREILDLIKEKNHIMIANKSDLSDEHNEEAVYISALNGEGIADLKSTLTKKVCDVEPENLEFVTNSRQQVCLNRAKTALDQALFSLSVKRIARFNFNRCKICYFST